MEPGDEFELSGALARLMADRELRRRLGDAGRVRASTHFGANVVVPQYEEAYRTLLEQRSAAGPPRW